MAIFPTFQFPNRPHPLPTGPQVDFSRIGQLYDSYADAQNDRIRREAAQEDLAANRQAATRDARIRAEFAGGLPTDTGGKPDIGKAAERLIALGDQKRGFELLATAGQAADRAATREFDERKFAAEDAHRRESLDVQRSQAVPAAVREYQFYAKGERAAGRQPVAFNEFKRASAAPSYTPFDRALANADVKRVTEYKDASDGAEELRGNLSELRAARAAATSAGRNLGPEWSWLPDYYPETQRVTSSAENVRLGFVNKTKGAVSDAEMRIFGNATPGTGMSDAAATPIIDAMDLGAQRTQERAIFFDAWLRSRGSLDGAPEAWKTFVDKNPIIIQQKNGTYALQPENVSSWRTKIPGLRPAGSNGSSDNGWVDVGGGVRIRERP